VLDSDPTETDSTSGPPTTGLVETAVESSFERHLSDTGAAGPPSLWAEVDGDGRIIAHLDDENTGCCPEADAIYRGTAPDLALEVRLDPDTFTSCTLSGDECMFSFTVTSAPYPPGDYDLDVVFVGEDQGTIQVHVP